MDISNLQARSSSMDISNLQARSSSMDISNLQELGEESFKIEDIFEDHLRGLIKDLVKGEANKREIEDNVYEWVEREVWDHYAKSPIDISGCEDKYDVEDRVKEWIVNNVKLPQKTYIKLIKTIDEFDKSVFRGGRILEEGVRLNNKTEFNKFVDYVEKRTGIEFYGDLGEADAIADYKEATGRDLDYLIGGVDDEEGHQLAYITLGYSVGKRGDEDFNYLIEPTEGEPVYEDGLPTWKEAADKVVAAIKKYVNSGVNESNRRYGRPLFEDIEVPEPQGNPFKVGDILAGTWGYSMIIPMFVQVIGVTPKSVRCRQLRVLNDNGFQGHDAMARKDDFKPENGNFPSTFLARVKGKPGEEYVMCPDPRCYLERWDGRGLYYDHMD